MIIFPTSYSEGILYPGKSWCLFVKQTSNALTSIYFWNLILMYIPWIIVFLKFKNTKISSNPSTLSIFGLVWLENLPPSYLFAPPSFLNTVLWQGTIHNFLLPPVSPGKSLRQAIDLMLPIQSDFPRLH